MEWPAVLIKGNILVTGKQSASECSPERAQCDTRESLERMRQLALVLEPHLQRDLGERSVLAGEELPHTLHAALARIFSWRAAKELTERASEMNGMHAGFRRNILHAKRRIARVTD